MPCARFGGGAKCEQQGILVDRPAEKNHILAIGGVCPVRVNSVQRYRGGAVEDDAERAAFVDAHHQHHAAGEIRIRQGRIGDQQEGATGIALRMRAGGCDQQQRRAKQ